MSKGRAAKPFALLFFVTGFLLAFADLLKSSCNPYLTENATFKKIKSKFSGIFFLQEGCFKK